MLVRQASTAVDRLLSGIDEPDLRDLAVRAAVTRVLDVDVLGVIVDAERASTRYDWLLGRSFVRLRANGREEPRQRQLRHSRVHALLLRALFT